MFNVLILDDREDYLRALRGALRSDFEIVTAQTVPEAKELFDASVKVGLVDIRLAEDEPNNREGLDFLRWAKETRPAVPMVMMSAYRDFDALAEALNWGADYFLKKPIELRELRALLRDFAEKGLQPEKTAELRKHFPKEAPR